MDIIWGMTNIRDILAKNMRAYRNALGLTHAQLAEKVDTSTHYIGMIETKNKFPSPEMLERIAYALGIDTMDLFSTEHNLPEIMKAYRKTALNSIKNLLLFRCQKIIIQHNIQLQLYFGIIPCIAYNKPPTSQTIFFGSIKFSDNRLSTIPCIKYGNLVGLHFTMSLTISFIVNNNARRKKSSINILSVEHPNRSASLQRNISDVIVDLSSS